MTAPIFDQICTNKFYSQHVYFENQPMFWQKSSKVTFYFVLTKQGSDDFLNLSKEQALGTF